MDRLFEELPAGISALGRFASGIATLLAAK
jgi:hypothetical protein